MSLRDHACFAELAEDLRAFAKGRRLVEIVNSGNWGDALIHAGQAEFLAHAGVEVQQVPIGKLRNPNRRGNKLRRLLPWQRAIITGSGAYREVYNRPAEFAFAARQFTRVLVMPSSFPFAPDFNPKRTILWRRDNAESLTGAPQARFCHDMAFFLNPAPREATQDVGLFFREDAERSEIEVPEGNEDISAEGTHQTPIDPFFDRIGEFRIIHTNRLHVAIGAALLGREVHLYPGSNDKIRSMYEASLKPYYDNIHFHADARAAVLSDG